MSDDIFSDPEMQDRLMNSMIKKFELYRTAAFFGDKAKDKIFGNVEKDLSRKEKELSILKMRRELGLGDYEPEGDKAGSGAIDQIGRSITKRALDPKSVLFNAVTSLTKDKGALTISKTISGVLPSLANPKNLAKGSTYGRIFGNISRAAGL